MSDHAVRHARLLSVALLTALALALASTPACSRRTPAEDERDSSGETSKTGTSTPETSGSMAAPGIYELDDGRVEAVGTLLHIELEGGFWAVTNAPAGSVPTEVQPDVVAVIPNATEVRPNIERLAGEYVAVRGTRIEGTSIRMAGPEIKAESIEIVEGDVKTP